MRKRKILGSLSSKMESLSDTKSDEKTIANKEVFDSSDKVPLDVSDVMEKIRNKRKRKRSIKTEVKTGAPYYYSSAEKKAIVVGTNSGNGSFYDNFVNPSDFMKLFIGIMVGAFMNKLALDEIETNSNNDFIFNEVNISAKLSDFDDRISALDELI